VSRAIEQEGFCREGDRVGRSIIGSTRSGEDLARSDGLGVEAFCPDSIASTTCRHARPDDATTSRSRVQFVVPNNARQAR